MNIYLDLFLTFARIGGFTFGGGYAMLPMLQKELVEKRSWLTEAELIDYYAIGQCTPGIIAVNTATFCGNRVKGALGGAVSTLGVIAPSLIIIIVIAAFIANFQDLPLVQNAFAGIRICVFILILKAIIKLLKTAVIDVPTGIICTLVALGSIIFNLSPIAFILASAAIGIALKLRKSRAK